MARIKARRMFWTDPQATDVVEIDIYAQEGDAATNEAFLAAIEADQLEPPHATVPAGVGQYFLADLEEKTYNLAIAAKDKGGNHSSVAQIPAWIGVALDVSPPDAPIPLGLD